MDQQSSIKRRYNSMSRPQAKSYRKKPAAAVGNAHHGYGYGYGHGGGGRRPPTRWPSKVMDGFRKMLVGLFPLNPYRPPAVTFFPVDHVVDRSTTGGGGGGDHVVVPKRSSCSSNLQPVNTHYDEAIADCVEFFHKSARLDVIRSSN